MITLLLPAKDIRNGMKVRKPTGAKPYTLRTDINIYGEGAKLIKTDDSIRFLVSEEGNINIITPDLVLALDLEVGDAIELLEEMREVRRSHK